MEEASQQLISSIHSLQLKEKINLSFHFSESIDSLIDEMELKDIITVLDCTNRYCIWFIIGVVFGGSNPSTNFRIIIYLILIRLDCSSIKKELELG